VGASASLPIRLDTELADQGSTAEQVNAITAVVNLHTDSYGDRVENFQTIWNRGDFK